MKASLDLLNDSACANILHTLLATRLTLNTRAGTDTVYSHNVVNEYTAIDGTQVTHDNAGNLSADFNGYHYYYDPNLDQIAVSDTDNNRIQLFQLNGYGDFDMIYSNQLSELDLSDPMATACASSDTQQILYIADTGNDRIIKVQKIFDQPGGSSLHVFEGFKAALYSGDVDKALEFFTDIAAENFATLMQQLSPWFQDMVSDMVDLVLISNDVNTAHCDLLRDEDGQLYGYPIFFIMDKEGNWKISNF